MGQWLVRIGESMLKSRPVRKYFTRVIRTTLFAQCRLRDAKVKIHVEGGLMFVSGEKDAEIVDALMHTFGVNAVDPYTEIPATPEDVAIAALQANPDPKGTFAVQCKRHGKKGEWNSQTFAGSVGAAVLEKVDLKVNLGNPEWAIRVALFPDKALLLGTRFMGPGGLPIGVQGLVLAHLDDEKDLLCAWLMMHRGCRIKPIDGNGDLLKEWDPALASEEFANELGTGPGGEKNPNPWGVVGFHLPDAPTTVPLEDSVRTPLVHLEPLVGWSEEDIAELSKRVFA